MPYNTSNSRLDDKNSKRNQVSVCTITCKLLVVFSNKTAMVVLERSPEFLALEALLLSIMESFEQYMYKEHGVL